MMMISIYTILPTFLSQVVTANWRCSHDEDDPDDIDDDHDDYDDDHDDDFDDDDEDYL